MMLIRETGTQTFNFVLRADEYPLDGGLPDLLVNQRNATHLSPATQGTRRGVHLAPRPRIRISKKVVHMGAAHVGLTQVEVGDLIVSFPLVSGAPRQRDTPRSHSDVTAEVQRTPFGRDRPTGIPQTRIEVQSVFPHVGHFITRV